MFCRQAHDIGVIFDVWDAGKVARILALADGEDVHAVEGDAHRPVFIIATGERACVRAAWLREA